MDTLREGLQEEIGDLNSCLPKSDSKDLRDVAKIWSCYVLQANIGKVLEYGLEISKAITNYLNELDNHPNQ